MPTASRHLVRTSQVSSWQALALALLVLCPLVGCGSRAGIRKPREVIVRDVPAVFQGTIGSRATLGGVDDTLISGFGLVVGLRGTGGGPYPPAIQAHIERELALIDVNPRAGKWQGTPLEGQTPAQVLRMRDVAIVFVYAAVPPGLPAGAQFDLYVRALDNSGTTSLEGGILMPVGLSVGRPSIYGQAQTHTIAEGSGELFINPYATPGKEGSAVTRTIGRVLDGGIMTEPMSIAIALDNPSPSLARTVVDSINSRFPRQAGDHDEVARGRGTKGDFQVIELTVPDRYVDNTADFVNLIRYRQVDYMYAADYAFRYANALKTEYSLGEDLAWALEAVGRPALPFVRPLYDSSEAFTQFYALRAGARLGDGKAAEYLIDIAQTKSSEFRIEAIELMRTLDRPRVDVVLRELVAEDELRIRTAAYEALVWRAEQVRISQILQNTSPGSSLTAEQLRKIRREASITLPPGMLQGIRRIPMGGGSVSSRPKFYVDLVPFGEPLIYVTQHGVPRIVLFGEQIDFEQDLLVQAWDGRLMFRRNGETDGVHVYYELPGSDGRPGATVARDYEVEPNFLEMLEFLATKPHRTSPIPGLDLTYSETVGAIAALLDGGGLDAGFATETDRLRARLLAAASVTRTPDRAATDAVADIDAPFLDGQVPDAGAAGEPARAESLVVPIRIREGGAGSP
jgi:Flagellar P-ring protein